ncbi:MAG TPA: HdeA/HdeB family chaperone [Alphaproteobacteria bacterium]|nr:HdeA/HdeB family chaperone [Alphaproteobacteria bacterium]
MSKKFICIFSFIMFIFSVAKLSAATLPTSVNLEDFTCKDFINVMTYEYQEKNIGYDNLSTNYLLMWMEGHSAQSSRIISSDLLTQIVGNFSNNCLENPGSSVLTVYRTERKMLLDQYTDKEIISDSLEITDRPCRSVPRDDKGNFAQNTRFIIFWINGYISKSSIFSFSAIDKLITDIEKKCTQDPNLNIMSLIKEIN